MVSDFLLPFSWLNLLSLSQQRQEELDALGVPLEAVVYFEYGQEDGYWEGSHLLSQVKDRALSIAIALYLGYQFLFLFNNATSHAVYAEDALLVRDMNKSTGGKQPFLRNSWFEKDGQRHVQSMTFLDPSSVISDTPVLVQKDVQMILQERGLWPAKGLKLVCAAPECLTCQTFAKRKAYTKGSRCSSCLEKKVHSNKYTVKRLCDECRQRKERCTCVTKKYCEKCAGRIGKKCLECKKLPPKCTLNGTILSWVFLSVEDLILRALIDCCSKRLLSIQPDFETQKCAIEELITGNANKNYPHLTMYYPKFHCELNHIEQFWCHGKQRARDMCDYTLEGLRKHILIALASVFSSTILANYKSCLWKMDLYQQGIGYGDKEWKRLTSQQKVYVKGDNRWFRWMFNYMWLA